MEIEERLAAIENALHMDLDEPRLENMRRCLDIHTGDIDHLQKAVRRLEQSKYVLTVTPVLEKERSDG